MACSSPTQVPDDILERVRGVCLELPEVTVRGDRIGVRLAEGSDWEEIRELVTESYRRLAPKKLSRLLDEQRSR